MVGFNLMPVFKHKKRNQINTLVLISRLLVFIMFIMVYMSPSMLVSQDKNGNEISFDVSVSTGSGSKSSQVNDVVIPIDSKNITTNKEPVDQASSVPASNNTTPTEIKSDIATEAPMRPSTEQQKQAESSLQEKGSATESNKDAVPDNKSNGGGNEKLTPEYVAAVLKNKQKVYLASYNFDISSLKDPFLPIAEVINKPKENVACPEGNEDCCDESDQSEGCEVNPNANPIETFDYSQIKLVAITILSGSSEGLAAFEDGAGVSYILRAGDKIGRHKGVIRKIEPDRVIIDEPSTKKRPAQVVEIKLNVLDTSSVLSLEANK